MDISLHGNVNYFAELSEEVVVLWSSTAESSTDFLNSPSKQIEYLRINNKWEGLSFLEDWFPYWRVDNGWKELDGDDGDCWDIMIAKNTQ